MAMLGETKTEYNISCTQLHQGRRKDRGAVYDIVLRAVKGNKNITKAIINAHTTRDSFKKGLERNYSIAVKPDHPWGLPSETSYSSTGDEAYIDGIVRCANELYDAGLVKDSYNIVPYYYAFYKSNFSSSYELIKVELPNWITTPEGLVLDYDKSSDYLPKFISDKFNDGEPIYKDFNAKFLIRDAIKRPLDSKDIKQSYLSDTSELLTILVPFKELVVFTKYQSGYYEENPDGTKELHYKDVEERFGGEDNDYGIPTEPTIVPLNLIVTLVLNYGDDGTTTVSKYEVQIPDIIFTAIPPYFSEQELIVTPSSKFVTTVNHMYVENPPVFESLRPIKGLELLSAPVEATTSNIEVSWYTIKGYSVNTDSYTEIPRTDTINYTTIKGLIDHLEGYKAVKDSSSDYFPVIPFRVSDVELVKGLGKCPKYHETATKKGMYIEVWNHTKRDLIFDRYKEKYGKDSKLRSITTGFYRDKVCIDLDLEGEIAKLNTIIGELNLHRVGWSTCYDSESGKSGDARYPGTSAEYRYNVHGDGNREAYFNGEIQHIPRHYVYTALNSITYLLKPKKVDGRIYNDLEAINNRYWFDYEINVFTDRDRNSLDVLNLARATSGTTFEPRCWSPALVADGSANTVPYDYVDRDGKNRTGRASRGSLASFASSGIHNNSLYTDLIRTVFEPYLVHETTIQAEAICNQIRHFNIMTDSISVAIPRMVQQFQSAESTKAIKDKFKDEVTHFANTIIKLFADDYVESLFGIKYTENGQLHKYARPMCTNVGINVDQMYAGLGSPKDDTNPVEDIFIIPAVKVTEQSECVSRYLYAFFKKYEKTTNRIITIADYTYSHKVAWTSCTVTNIPTKIDKASHTQYGNNLLIRVPTSKDTHSQIVVSNLQCSFTVVGKASIALDLKLAFDEARKDVGNYGSSPSGEYYENKGNFLIPIRRDAFYAIGALHSSELAKLCIHQHSADVYTYKTPWYSGWLIQAIVWVIAVLCAWFTNGASLKAAAILSAALSATITMVIFRMIAIIASKLFGPEIGAVVAAVVATAIGDVSELVNTISSAVEAGATLASAIGSTIANCLTLASTQVSTYVSISLALADAGIKQVANNELEELQNLSEDLTKEFVELDRELKDLEQENYINRMNAYTTAYLNKVDNSWFMNDISRYAENYINRIHLPVIVPQLIGSYTEIHTKLPKLPKSQLNLGHCA